MLLAVTAGLERGRCRQQLHEVLLLAEPNAAARLDWSRTVVDFSHVRAIEEGARRDRVRSIVAEPDRNTT